MKQRPAHVRSRAVPFFAQATAYRPASAGRASEESTLVLWPSDVQTLVLRPTQSLEMRDRVLAAFRRAFARFVY